MINPSGGASTASGSGATTGSASTGSGAGKPSKAMAGMTPLPSTFVPGDRDVICARGKAAKDHSGNVWFRDLIGQYIQEYSECETKLDKSFLVSKIIKIVRKESPQGGFIKRVGGVYYDVGDRLSREKIGQSKLYVVARVVASIVAKWRT